MSDRDDRIRGQRTEAERSADHAAIGRLADEVLPALMARLGRSSLGELEISEDIWRIRLRRPPGERRASSSGRSGPGRAREESRATEPGRSGDPAQRRGDPPDAPTGTSGRSPTPEGDELPPLTAIPIEAAEGPGVGPPVATSPAVGIFRLRGELRTGTRVRAGDRLAAVDMLGVPQEVTAPIDGIVATALVDDGDAVEYGQALVVLEPISTAKGA